MQLQYQERPLPRDLSHLLSKCHAGHHISCKCHDSCHNLQKNFAKTKPNMHFFTKITFKPEIKASDQSCDVVTKALGSCPDLEPLERSSAA